MKKMLLSITTIIVSILYKYHISRGSVRGFAETLAIGVCRSFISIIFPHDGKC